MSTRLCARITINWPANINSVRYLKKFCGDLANECPELEDMNWEKVTTWSCEAWAFNTDISRSNLCDSVKYGFETDGGRWTGSRERPFICDILKLELFDPDTHELKAMKEWAPKPPTAHIA